MSSNPGVPNLAASRSDFTLDNISRTCLEGVADKHKKITLPQRGLEAGAVADWGKEWAIVNVKKKLGNAWEICPEGPAHVIRRESGQFSN